MKAVSQYASKMNVGKLAITIKVKRDMNSELIIWLYEIISLTKSMILKTYINMKVNDTEDRSVISLHYFN